MTGASMEVSSTPRAQYEPSSNSNPATDPARELDRVGGVQVNVDVARLSSPDLTAEQRDAILLNQAIAVNGATAYASTIGPQNLQPQLTRAQGNEMLSGSQGLSTANAADAVHGAVLDKVRGDLAYLNPDSREAIAQTAAHIAANFAAGREAEIRAQEKSENGQSDGTKAQTHRPWRFAPATDEHLSPNTETDRSEGPDRTFEPLWSAEPQKLTAQDAATQVEQGKRLGLYQAPGAATDDPFQSAFDAMMRPQTQPAATVQAAEVVKEDVVTAANTPQEPLSVEAEPAVAGPFRISNVRGHATFVRQAA